MNTSVLYEIDTIYQKCEECFKELRKCKRIKMIMRLHIRLLSQESDGILLPGSREYFHVYHSVTDQEVEGGTRT